jgi:hypothetical protein
MRWWQAGVPVLLIGAVMGFYALGANWAALVAGVLFALAVLEWALLATFVLRVAATACPECGCRLRRPAARAAVPYYHHLYGSKVIVFDGPRRYLGAQVVRCSACGTEAVFSEAGRYVERFFPVAGV